MDVNKHIQEAIAWLASEHKYFGELKDDLTQLRNDLESARAKEQVKDIKKAFRDFRYLARSEQRFQRHEQQIEEALTDLRKQKITVSGTIQEIQDFLQQLHMEAANLIRDSSFYEGRIRKLLTYLQADIQDHHLEQAQAVLMEIMQVVDDADKWIAAVSVDLNKAKKIVRESQEVPDPNWEDFDSPETQRQIQALLVQRGFKYLSVHENQPPHSDIVIQAYFCEPKALFWIRQSRKTKYIDIGFPAPVLLGWDQNQFSLHFDVERERKKDKHFKQFLEKLLQIIQKCTEPHGPRDVSNRILQELRQ